uniref:Uncharacterized protein n=1 Tax=Ananas comosus var. bracteatus TaxID=296719 RepID=A0A6V7QIZ8_ANACO|nr:unnamed protein product [Ananas comosus var. bracteatus]
MFPLGKEDRKDKTNSLDLYRKIFLKQERISPLHGTGARICNFPPEWVPAEVLIRREVLSLNEFWIRCYRWGQYRDAQPHRLQYSAWIRLLNLPFECWTVARVAALVGGFGRFVKADATTKAMTDLRAFRCQIVLDSVWDIPQNLSVVLGEESFPVMVHLESWRRVAEGGGADPPAPPQNGPDNDEHDDQEGEREDEGDDEGMEDEAGVLEEADPNQQLLRASPATAGQRAYRTVALSAAADLRPHKVADPERRRTRNSQDGED